VVHRVTTLLPLPSTIGGAGERVGIATGHDRWQGQHTVDALEDDVRRPAARSAGEQGRQAGEVAGVHPFAVETEQVADLFMRVGYAEQGGTGR